MQALTFNESKVTGVVINMQKQAIFEPVILTGF